MTHDSDDEHEDEGCPVCDEHTEAEALNSQGLVFTGMKALFEADNATIKNVYDLMTPYDGHTAIGLAAALLHDIAVVLHGDPLQFIESYQQGLNSAQATVE